MAGAKSPNAYNDIVAIFERVLASGPTTVEFPNDKKANSFRMRIHAARRVLREHNNKLHPIGDPNHNIFPWDNIQVLHRGNKIILREHTDIEYNIRPATQEDIDGAPGAASIPD